MASYSLLMNLFGLKLDLDAFQAAIRAILSGACLVRRCSFSSRRGAAD
ncbi:MAG: hypothetical protein MZV70_37210 [Desulfobacterales bacterium]|nr:hypothetical protein [Desulfobacterales bacterium]